MHWGPLSAKCWPTPCYKYYLRTMTRIITSDTWLRRRSQILNPRSHSSRTQLKGIWEWSSERKRARMPEGVFPSSPRLYHRPCPLSTILAPPNLWVVLDQPHVHPHWVSGISLLLWQAASKMAPVILSSSWSCHVARPPCECGLDSPTHFW